MPLKKKKKLIFLLFLARANPKLPFPSESKVKKRRQINFFSPGADTSVLLPGLHLPEASLTVALLPVLQGDKLNACIHRD